jgi:hypothetical protein
MSTREEKICEVNKQLAILEQEMNVLSKLTQESTQQFAKIKKFGIQQTSFFISAHAVFQKLNEDKELGK